MNECEKKVGGWRPLKKTLLSIQNVKARLRFAYFQWITEEWSWIVFSDKFAFNFFKICY